MGCLKFFLAGIGKQYPAIRCVTLVAVIFLYGIWRTRSEKDTTTPAPVVTPSKAMSLPPSNRPRPSRHFSFMKLAPELRQMIYLFCFEDREHERCHDQGALLDAAYLEGVQRAGTDPSLSLLRLNNQLFREVTGELRRSSIRITIRVTAQGMALENIALLPCTNQGRKERREKRTEFLLELWPPHPDRPIESFFIWDHMRLFRERLKGVNSPYTLILRFIDNLFFTWAPDRRPSRNLSSLGVRNENGNEWTKHRNDLQTIANLLHTRSNVQITYFFLPISYPRRIDAPTRRFRIINPIIQSDKEGSVRSSTHDRLFEKLMIESGQVTLIYRTASIAWKKLRKMTNRGKDKICERQFDRLVTPWPYFELLD
ncbi:MAG: hypothetical protein Q9212_007285, partial [Teloschistes hypoglaucus]